MGRKIGQLMVAWIGLMLLNICWGEAAPDSEIWLYYIQDELQAKEYLASMSLSVSEDDMIFINLGSTDSKQFNEKITTSQMTLGFSSFRTSPVAVDIFYDYWGSRGELEIDTLGLGFTYYADDWSLGIPFEYQNIEFFSRESSLLQRRFTVEGYGLGLNYQVDGQHLSWVLSGMWYDYSANLANLNTARALFLLGAKNLTHAAILNDWIVSSSLGYQWVDTSLSLLAVHSISAIDQADSDTVALNLSVDVSRRISLSVEAGRVFGRFDLTTDYASVGMGFGF